MSVGDKITAASEVRREASLQRGPWLITAGLASLGGAAIYLCGLPTLWRMSLPYGLLFAVLGVVQLGLGGAMLMHPSRRRVLFAAGVALAVVTLWVLGQIIRILPSPDPWVAVNSAIGFTSYICAILETIAAVGMFVVVSNTSHLETKSPLNRIVAVACVPLGMIVLVGSFIGVAGSSDGFAGAGIPSDVVSAQNLPAGEMSTVEYCRPDAVPLAMDIYMPPVAAIDGRPAPVALYAHGGGIWGDRKMYGLGASQGGHQGALFTLLQQQLNDAGFVVASIDYRLPPGTPWPAQIEDVKCAVRFLRAHAADLGINPERIGVWGSSGGGWLVTLLGLAGPQAGFDQGQYLNQSSAVQAVVDMFGAADLEDVDDFSAFVRFILWLSIDDSPELRREASPTIYITQDAPPFLILHGTEDPSVDPHQSTLLAQQLQDVGVPATLIEVQGAEHSLNTPGEQPTSEELAVTVVDFYVETLK